MQLGRSRRRSLRRAVAIPCAMQSDYWDGAVTLPASDLSTEGVWIDTPLPLEPGEELVLAFNPPGEPEAELWALAEVARVGMWRRAQDAWPSGMGLTFTYVSRPDRRLLSRCLVGRPPRLPARRMPPQLPRSTPGRDADLSLPPVLALDGAATESEEDPWPFRFQSMSSLLTSPQPAYIWGRTMGPTGSVV